MGVIRESFIIFKNWIEAINELPEEFQLETYKALASYGINGQIPDGISNISKAILKSFSKDMESNIAKYIASVQNGKLGGRPSKSIIQKTEKTQENLLKPKNNLTKPTANPYDNVYDNVIKEKEIYKEKEKFLKDAELSILIEKEFVDAEVCQRFKEYVAMRKAMGKNKAIRTVATFESCVKKLRKFAKTKDEALEVLDYSISNCYQGLFDIFKHTNKTKKQETIPYAN